MTVLGKIMAFVIVAVSLAALGVSLWLAVDARDWKAERDAIRNEIRQRREAQDRELRALYELLQEIDHGDRKMRWDSARHLGQDSSDAVTVREAREEIKKLEQENLDLFDEANRKSVTLSALIGDLDDARAETMAAIAEQRRLRDLIQPDPPDPNRPPLRDVIGNLRIAREAAEKEQDRVRPLLFNELVKVSLLDERQQQLRQRLAELQAGKSTASTKP